MYSYETVYPKVSEYFERDCKNKTLDPSDRASLLQWGDNFIPGLNLTTAGGVLPFQAEGNIYGYRFYFRSEWDSQSLKVSRPGALDPPYLLDEAYWCFSTNHEPKNFLEFLAWFIVGIESLEKAPFRYEFPTFGRGFRDSPDGGTERYTDYDKEDTVSGWGYSPAEAFLDAASPSAYLRDHGHLAAKQIRDFYALEPAPYPLNSDDRDYVNNTLVQFVMPEKGYEL